MKTILVTGIGGTRSIGVMNSLRLMEEPVRIVGTDANYFNAGSYQCDSAYLVPFASDPEYLPRLKTIIKDERVSIVFATVEKEVAFLAQHKADIEEDTGAIVLVPDPDILAICFDKFKTQQFLAEHGFDDIPAVVSASPDELRNFADSQGFPLIRKPLAGYGSRGVSRIDNQAELMAYEADDTYVLQKCIESDDTETFYNTVLNEYTAEVFINQDGSVAGGIIIKRALHAGETVAGYRVDDDSTLAYLSKVAQELGIHGPCNFQYRKQNGKVYVFEINPLFSGTTFIRAKYGFNNVALAIRSFVQGSHETIPQSALKDYYFIRYLTESFIDPADMATLRETEAFNNE